MSFTREDTRHTSTPETFSKKFSRCRDSTNLKESKLNGLDQKEGKVAQKQNCRKDDQGQVMLNVAFSVQTPFNSFDLFN